MGANFDKYCTCLNNNGNQNEETSLAHKDSNSAKIEQSVLDNLTKVKHNNIINCNTNNGNVHNNRYDISSKKDEESIAPKAKLVPIKTETANTVTDRIDPSPTPGTQIINYSNGNVYTGDMLNSKREGKGKLTFPLGGYYNGDFHNDRYDGYGTLCSENTIYHGTFIKGEKEGEGRSENIKECTEFTGTWKYNQRNGFGKEVFADGSFFEGNFINGAKSGIGVLHLSNGCEYQGEFVDDCIEGKGTFVWNENKRYIGNWRQNALSGFGTLIQEKDKHIGYYNNDKKNGLGITLFFKSKSFILGNWVEDNVQGLAIYSMPNQVVQFWEMNENKLVHAYSSNEEIRKIKESQEYQNLKLFYYDLMNNHLIDDLVTKDTFSM